MKTSAAEYKARMKITTPSGYVVATRSAVIAGVHHVLQGSVYRVSHPFVIQHASLFADIETVCIPDPIVLD
jgi:hypothetical protein